MSRLTSGSPPKSEDQVNLKNWRMAPFNKWAFSHVRNIIPTQLIPSGNRGISFSGDIKDLSFIKIKNGENKSLPIGDFLESFHTDSFVVIKDGKLIWSWYGEYAAQNVPHIIFSISKSLTALAALSLTEDKVLDLHKPLSYYIPEVKSSAYEDATARNLLDMNVSSNFEENYLAKSGIFHEYRNATGWNEVDPNNRNDLWNFLPKISKGFEAHGQSIHYCSPHTDLLGWLLERVSGQRFFEVLATRILQPCGMEYDAYVTVDFSGASRAAGGVNICALDLAKVGEMVRCDGYFRGIRVLREDTVNDICSYDNGVSWKNKFPWADQLFPMGRYRSNWYQTQSADREVFGSGIHGQWLWINPVKKITIVRLASNPLPLEISDKDLIVDAFRQIIDVISD